MTEDQLVILKVVFFSSLAAADLADTGSLAVHIYYSKKSRISNPSALTHKSATCKSSQLIQSHQTKQTNNKPTKKTRPNTKKVKHTYASH